MDVNQWQQYIVQGIASVFRVLLKITVSPRRSQTLGVIPIQYLSCGNGGYGRSSLQASRVTPPLAVTGAHRSQFFYDCPDQRTPDQGSAGSLD